MLTALVEIVCHVGSRLLGWRDDGGTDGHWEGTQFKADADQRAHDAFVAALGRLAPTIPVVSEEDEQARAVSRPDRYFLIDPIDGTASYARGFPSFVTQVALMDAGRPTMAAVHAPVLGVTWRAACGGGAFLDDRRLRLAPRGARLLVIDNYPQPRGVADALVRLLPATGYLECGSIALKACRVADGTADVFVKDVAVYDWDVAPADLILSEAGGLMTDDRGLAFDYHDSTEKHGVIAVADAATAARVLSVLNEREPR
jgi:3'(2'), 5'-bisphosphate nucleotidase